MYTYTFTRPPGAASSGTVEARVWAQLAACAQVGIWHDTALGTAMRTHVLAAEVEWRVGGGWQARLYLPGNPLVGSGDRRHVLADSGVQAGNPADVVVRFDPWGSVGDSRMRAAVWLDGTETLVASPPAAWRPGSVLAGQVGASKVVGATGSLDPDSVVAVEGGDHDWEPAHGSLFGNWFAYRPPVGAALQTPPGTAHTVRCGWVGNFYPSSYPFTVYNANGWPHLRWRRIQAEDPWEQMGSLDPSFSAEDRLQTPLLYTEEFGGTRTRHTPYRLPLTARLGPWLGVYEGTWRDPNDSVVVSVNLFDAMLHPASAGTPLVSRMGQWPSVAGVRGAHWPIADVVGDGRRRILWGVAYDYGESRERLLVYHASLLQPAPQTSVAVTGVRGGAVPLAGPWLWMHPDGRVGIGAQVGTVLRSWLGLPGPGWSLASEQDIERHLRHPSVVTAPSGEQALVGWSDGSIWVVRRAGGDWSEPVEIAAAPETRAYLLQLPDGRWETGWQEAVASALEWRQYRADAPLADWEVWEP